MTNFRVVVRHVRYWRGAVHKWSTSYTFSGSPSSPLDDSDAASFLLLDDAMCYGHSDPTNGGTYQCQIYNLSTGGTAIASSTHFDVDIPANWIAYGGTAWGSVTVDQEPTAETALQVEWNAGVSSSGKPVRLRKWFHAVPQSAAGGGSADITPTKITSLTTGANALKDGFASKGLLLSSTAGRFAGSSLVLPYYGNHQMPRGRRRKPLVTADGRYTGPTINQVPILAD